jgi:hypothetical protein
MLIDLIAGARPNFMKVAPIIRAMEARTVAGGPLATGWYTPASTMTPGCRGPFLSN